MRERDRNEAIFLSFPTLQGLKQWGEGMPGPQHPAHEEAGGAAYGERQRGPPSVPTSRGTARSRARKCGARGGAVAEAMVKGWVTEPPLHSGPSQQKP